MTSQTSNAPVVTSTIQSGIATIIADYPPVNALGYIVRAGLSEALSAAEADDAVDAIVIACAGRTFFAGADITEFGKPMRSPDLRELIEQIEGMRRPVVAAIHGTALGGGLELALGCHYRCAIQDAKLGLPEILLGLIPGAGGTQLLPRLIGAERALDLILTGRAVTAREAAELGIVDTILEGELLDSARAFARQIAAAPPPRLRDHVMPSIAASAIDTARSTYARRVGSRPALEGVLEALQTSAMSFEEGMATERRIIRGLFDTSQSRALRHIFFAERAAAKVSGIDSAAAATVRRVGVVGAGTMGGGIAMAFVNAGIPVTLVEVAQESLDRGVATIRRNYEATARKGRMTDADVAARMGAITPSTDLQSVSDADLVIEAVFESMSLKKELFARLDTIVRDDAILASNTSFLDLDEIASATARPERVVGLHFFSPANVMKLLEVVRGAKSSDHAVATAMAVAKRIGKTAVLSGVCDGFIANRAMRARSDQADRLILEGIAPERIDRAMVDYGFAMGPFAMMDLVGLDVIGRGSTERTVMGDLVERGRLGQKQGGGYYDYDEQRRATPSPDAREVIAAVAAERGLKPREIDDTEIVARLLYPVVNEGAKILAEGIAQRASDIDVALVTGYGWPASHGGPMIWADEVGLDRVVALLDVLAEEQGGSGAARLLRELAETGGKLSTWQATNA